MTIPVRFDKVLMLVVVPGGAVVFPAFQNGQIVVARFGKAEFIDVNWGPWVEVPVAVVPEGVMFPSHWPGVVYGPESVLSNGVMAVGDCYVEVKP